MPSKSTVLESSVPPSPLMRSEWRVSFGLSVYHNLEQSKAQSACTESTRKGVHFHPKTSDKHNQHKRLESAEGTLAWHVGKYKIRTPPEVHPQLIDHFQRMYLWWSLCILYLLACQVRVAIGNLGHCCHVYRSDVFWMLINSPVNWFYLYSACVSHFLPPFCLSSLFLSVP